MALCKKMGLHEDTYLYRSCWGDYQYGRCRQTISVLTLAAVHTGHSSGYSDGVVVASVWRRLARGASGVPGGSLLLIPMACSLIGISNDISTQVVAVGFIIGVVQDSCETALNSSTDVLFTAAADIAERRKAA